MYCEFGRGVAGITAFIRIIPMYCEFDREVAGITAFIRIIPMYCECGREVPGITAFIRIIPSIVSLVGRWRAFLLSRKIKNIDSNK